MEQETPDAARLQLTLQRLSIVLTVTTGLLALGIVLMLYSPPVARRDFEIRLLQDKLQAQADEVARLRAYAREVQQQQDRVKEWEESRKAEETFRENGYSFRQQLLTELEDIRKSLPEVCNGTRPDR